MPPPSDPTEQGPPPPAPPTRSTSLSQATDAQKAIMILLVILIAIGGFLAYKASQPAAKDCGTTTMSGPYLVTETPIRCK